MRSQRVTISLPQNCLDNLVFQLGASHTLRNVVCTIFTHHFGNSTDMSNCGAWKHLEALSFPSEKAIQRNEFNLIINQVECVFEGMVYYYLR